MEQYSQKEDPPVSQRFQGIGERWENGILSHPQVLQVPDGKENVLIDSIKVIVIMPCECLDCPELRKISAQKAQFLHEVKGFRQSVGIVENCDECFRRRWRRPCLIVDPACSNQRLHM